MAKFTKDDPDAINPIADSDYLPKYVIGGVNPNTGSIGFVKAYDANEDGSVVPGSWRIMLFAHHEEAVDYYQSYKDTINKCYRPIHLDDLHREFARWLIDNGQTAATGVGGHAEELYRLANHIDSAKGSLPDEWQDWADGVVGDLRKMSNEWKEVSGGAN